MSEKSAMKTEEIRASQIKRWILFRGPFFTLTYAWTNMCYALISRRLEKAGLSGRLSLPPPPPTAAPTCPRQHPLCMAKEKILLRTDSFSWCFPGWANDWEASEWCISSCTCKKSIHWSLFRLVRNILSKNTSLVEKWFASDDRRIPLFSVFKSPFIPRRL